MSIHPQVLYTFVRDGRTHMIVQANELVAEVVLEPAYDDAREERGYRYLVRSRDTVYPSEVIAAGVALQDVARLSRVQAVAVAAPINGGYFHAS